ncbi:MAG: DsbA family protein [Nanoarchaeota archaeon]|nr:DsbA family protein [Nanoarchaeota archaeon]
MENEETIKIKKSSMAYIAVVVLAVLLIVAIFTGGFGINSGNAVKSDNQANNAPAINMKQLIDDDELEGDVNAPVTIVEFSDYECPFCERFYSETYGQIKSEYIDTGKVNFVYRDFPLSSIHPQAQKAAEAAECAGEQGMYFEMYDKLFTSGVQGGVTSFKQYAMELGLNTEDFNTCLDSGEMANEVKKDMTDGQALGVKGTPAFFINGQMVSGAQPFSVFKQVIDAELAK